MPLHQFLAGVNVLSIAAGHWVQREYAVNLCICWIEPLGYDRAAKVPVSDHTHQLARGLVHYDRHGTNVLVPQHGSNLLRTVFRGAAHRIGRHNLAYFHEFSPFLLAMVSPASGLLLHD